MGEAKQRRRAHAAILERYPHCVFCGGSNRATTAEHTPPLMMFRRRQRPNELVFPSCKPCNNGTSHSDLVASFLGRSYPEATSKTDRDDDLRDYKMILQAIKNNIPGLLQEMERGIADETPLLKVDGPIVTSHMQVFGAKLGVALHFELFGCPVPLTGGVLPRWFSNVQAMRGEIPTSLLNILPGLRTMRQGRKDVSDQFQYTWVPTDEGQHTLFYAVFRQSFAIAAVTALERTVFLQKWAGKFPVFVPGQIRDPELETV
jgi:hypothetical protein